MNPFQISISFLAGLLATLSPCVLPVLPFVTASSLSKNKWGPCALAFGLLVAFVGTTLLLTITGEFFGLSQELLKKVAGLLLGASGLLLLVSSWQEAVTNFLSKWTQGFAEPVGAQGDQASLTQEFAGGFLLGVIWSPCSGPSLGVALGLATQAGGFSQAVVLLTAFGLGAVLPILVFAYGTKGLTKKLRAQGLKIQWIKKGTGFVMLVFGILIFTNFDKKFESVINQLLPESYIQWTTKF